MYKLELTEKQASFLVEMWVNHAEWADPLDQEDRMLYGLIEEASQSMPKVFSYVTRLKQEERKREAEANRKRREAEEAGN